MKKPLRYYRLSEDVFPSNWDEQGELPLIFECKIDLKNW